MCDFNEMIFIDSGRVKDVVGNKDVIITEATVHSGKGIRISFSDEAIKRLGQSVERVVFAASKNYRNRLYVYDVKRVAGHHNGFKLSKSGTRKCVRVDAKRTDFDIMKIIGIYQLERDKDNHLYIPLTTTI